MQIVQWSDAGVFGRADPRVELAQAKKKPASKKPWRA